MSYIVSLERSYTGLAIVSTMSSRYHHIITQPQKPDYSRNQSTDSKTLRMRMGRPNSKLWPKTAPHLENETAYAIATE